MFYLLYVDVNKTVQLGASTGEVEHHGLSREKKGIIIEIY